jgi:hypothetical protein
MHEKLILEKIRHVRQRLNVQRYFQTFATFLFYGFLACVPLVVVDSVTSQFNIPPLALLWVVFGIAAVALVIRLIRPVSLHEAARTIDTDGVLKDRVVSGLEQIQHQTDETLTVLQLQDTANRLQAVPLTQVARYAIPRETKFIALVSAFLTAFLFVEFFTPSATSTEIDLSPQIAAEAAPLFKQIEEAKKVAEQNQDQELKEILKEIEERALELKKPQIAPKEALARMTELSALLKTKIDPMKMARQEELMRGLGQQFIGNPYLGEFGQQLKRGDYQKAADKLDNVAKDVPKFDSEKRQNLSDELKRGGNSLKNTDLDGLGGELSGAGEALEGLEDDDSKGAQGRLGKASGKIRGFGLLKNRNWRLARLLSECQACKAGIAGVCSAAGITNKLSTGPSNRAGKATSANQLGEPTSLDASLNLEHVTGLQGDGPSTVQTTKASAEGQQSAVSYKEAYTKYQKLSEDALTEEQIPLGYKFYVKRYFEAIKPSNEQPAENDSK